MYFLKGAISKMGRIGFVTVSHPDYVNGVVNEVNDLTCKLLIDRGIELYRVRKLICSSKEAQLAGKDLLKADVDALILLLGSWIECPVAMSIIREVEHLPILIWGFPMTMVNGTLQSTGSYVSYAMFKGVMDRIGYSYKGVLGRIDQEETIDQVVNFAKASNAFQKLKRSKVGLVGYTSMSIYTGTFDHVLMRVKLGPEIEHIDSYTLIKTAENMDSSRLTKYYAMLRENTRISKDITGNDINKISSLFYAIMDLKEKRNLDAINVKCQYEFSKDYGMVMCVPLSLAADNGIIASCEGDILNTVSMMILHYLSGQVVTYGDAINHEGNILKISPCGFLPFSMGVPGQQYIQPFMPNRGFTGVQTSFVMRPERVTVLRIVEDIGDYHILYFTGSGQDTQLRDGYFPALDILLDGDINELLNQYSGQHYAVCYGDISAEIEDLANILKIKAFRI